MAKAPADAFGQQALVNQHGSCRVTHAVEWERGQIVPLEETRKPFANCGRVELTG